MVTRHILDPFFSDMKNKKAQDKIISWLKENTQDKTGERFKSSFEIAKGTGIGEAKVMHLCTIHKDIKRTRENGIELWGLYEDKSVYEDHEVIVI